MHPTKVVKVPWIETISAKAPGPEVVKSYHYRSFVGHDAQPKVRGFAAALLRLLLAALFMVWKMPMTFTLSQADVRDQWVLQRLG